MHQSVEAHSGTAFYIRIFNDLFDLLMDVRVPGSSLLSSTMLQQTSVCSHAPGQKFLRLTL